MTRPRFALPAGMPTAISREALMALPLRSYEGAVRLIATPRDLGQAVDDLRGERVVGFDTETRPAFVRGQSYSPALAQVATARAVYLFQLRHREVHGALAELLAAPGAIKAGVALAADLGKLQPLFAFEPASVVDLGGLAKRCGLKQGGVGNLTGLLLGWRISKGAQVTNWASRTLTAQQIAYAATDAWVCRELYLRFESLGVTAG